MATRNANAANEGRRIFEIAKDLGISTRELKSRVAEWDLDWDVSNHMKRLSAAQEKELADRLAGKKPRRAPAKKAAAKKAPAKKTAAKKAPAKKAAAKKDEAAAAPKKAAAKKTAAKKAPAKKAAAKKDEAAAAPKKAATKKAPAKKAPAKKADEAAAEAPTRTPVHAIAKELGVKAKELVEASKAWDGFTPLRSHMQRVDGDTAAEIARRFKGEDEPAPKRSRRGRRRNEDAPKKAAAAPKKAAAADKAPASKPPKRDEAGEKMIAAGIAYLTTVLSEMGLFQPRITGTASRDVIEFEISGHESERLLGRGNATARTDVLDSLEHLAARAIAQATQEQRRVRIDVGGFRQARMSQLATVADRLARFVKETGKPVSFGLMNSFDRFALHQSLGNDDEVRTESVGFGPFRRMGVFPARNS